MIVPLGWNRPIPYWGWILGAPTETTTEEDVRASYNRVLADLPREGRRGAFSGWVSYEELKTQLDKMLEDALAYISKQKASE